MCHLHELSARVESLPVGDTGFSVVPVVVSSGIEHEPVERIPENVIIDPVIKDLLTHFSIYEPESDFMQENQDSLDIVQNISQYDCVWIYQDLLRKV